MSAVQDTLTHPAFTPGPWISRPVQDDLDFDFEINREDGLAVAGVYQWSMGTSEANAHLIAAAPELYEALDLAYRGGMVDMAGSDFRDRVEAILAKVRGQ